MIWTECKGLQDSIVEIRRDLHQIPELGFELPETRAYVVKKLDEMGIDYDLSERDSGIVAYVNRGKPGKVVALRADMDALPIQEELDVEYKSKHDGCMHACGHDTHMAMLLGAAKVLNSHKDELNGEVRFLFQTNEEATKGAPVVIENGGVDGVDAVFGTHIGTIISKDIPTGTVICTPGPTMASFDKFTVKVKGIGCHGSTPEKGIDPVNAAAHVILAIQAINAREFNANVPVVATIGMIQGGAAYNAIPSEVVFGGTTRTFNEEVRNKVAKRIAEISENVAKAFGATAEVEIDVGAPPLINDPEMAAFASKCAAEVVGDDMVISHLETPNMGSEDFAFFLEKVPGAFMFLSSSNPEKGTNVTHHNPVFNVDEDVLWEGTACFVNIAEKFLNG